MHFGADLLEPGIVQLGYEVTIRLDELDGRITPRGESLKKALEYAMLTRVTENIWGCLWGKLVFQKA